MDTKRIRFGFVCSTTTPPVTSEMLCSIGIRSMECALHEDKQFVVFTVDKPTRASDVLSSLQDGFCLEKFDGCDDLIVTFEKGQRYLQHPFYVVVQGVKSAAVEDDASPRYWQWISDGEPVKRKRVVGELASDLVEESINPSATKRERVGYKQSEVFVIYFFAMRLSLTWWWQGPKQCKSSKSGYSPKNVAVDVKLMLLVSEVTKSKDETIAAKNYAIQLLETMLKNAGQTPVVVCETI